MKTRWGGVSRGFYFGFAGLVVLGCAAAISWNTLSAYAKNLRPGSSTAWYSTSSQANSNSSNQPTADKGALDRARQDAKLMSQAFHAAAEQVLPAVVTITTRPIAAKALKGSNSAPEDGDDNAEEIPFGFNGAPFGDMLKDPQLRQFFKGFHGMPNIPHGVSGSGSGVIVDPSGIILTNNHVVAGGGEVTVRLSDGREFKATGIKTDPKSDLAILRIDAGGALPAARLGRSSEVDVGDWVLALGQPFGLEGTVTAGIVSAKGRGLGITDREDFIQTDAAINPGNSGGPLVNIDGEVIGINTAISTNSGGYQGVGFAVPIDLAKWVGGQLEQSGTVHRAYLGVMIQPVTQEVAEQFKVKVHSGVLVREVRDNTPAAKAGVQPGDVILQFAGHPVNDPRQLQNIVEESPIGSSHPMVLFRDGKELTIDVTCNELPAEAMVATSPSSHSEGGSGSSFEQLGIQAETLTGALAEQLGVKADSGVAITEVRPGSPAAMAGLAKGMVITQANRKPVKSPADLRKALESRPLSEGLVLMVRTEEGNRMVMLRIGG
jgi:serine protease Do